jgi:hypothetical protein
MDETSIIVKNELRQLPCFNFFLGGVSTSVLPTSFSGTRIRFQINILMKVQHLKEITGFSFTKAQKNILLPTSGQNPGVAHPYGLQSCSPARNFEKH